jgi:hypothetical protein
MRKEGSCWQIVYGLQSTAISKYSKKLMTIVENFSKRPKPRPAEQISAIIRPFSIEKISGRKTPPRSEVGPKTVRKPEIQRSGNGQGNR